MWKPEMVGCIGLLCLLVHYLYYLLVDQSFLHNPSNYLSQQDRDEAVSQPCSIAKREMTSWLAVPGTRCGADQVDVDPTSTVS